MKSQLVERTGSLRLVESTKVKKGCLGRLEGPCADFKNATRNGRLYGLQLWKNVFNNKFVKEALSTKTLFGELDHPEDRFEVLAKYACVCMTDYSIDENEGIVYGGFDILDTEAGRILKSLVDYGSQMGVSSRGEGDIIQGENGEEVDPDTYDFACFDVVSTPAVERARQTVVESVEHNRKKRQLIESVEREIKNADTIEVLDNIERTVTNCNMPNLSRIKRSIKNRKSQIAEGKNISSKPTNNATKIRSSKKDTTAKTIRENMDSVNTFTTITELNRKIRAYKLREKLLNNSISQYKNKVDELSAELESTNNKLLHKDKALKESNNKRLKAVTNNRKLENTISIQNDKIDLLENVKSELRKEQRNNSQITRQHLTETQNLKDKNNALRKSNRSLQEQVDSLQQVNEELEHKLNQSESIIESYKVRQEQLKDSLQEQQNIVAEHKKTIKNQNITISEQDNNIREIETNARNQDYNNRKDIRALEESYNKLENSYNELERSYNELDSSYNSLNGDFEQANAQYNELLDSYRALESKMTSLTEKLNKSIKLNKQFTNSFLNECANVKGVNPNSVVLKESITTPNKIKQLVEEVKDRQDRYNKLPISYDKPTTVNILNEDIQKNNETAEDIELETFLTSVQDIF